MLLLLSPAKTLDYETPERLIGGDLPSFHKESNQLIRILKKKSLSDLKNMMKISDKLAAENKERYQKYDKAFPEELTKAAIEAFKGDVYTGLEIETLDDNALQFADQHIRILSGLYGLLKPSDRMQPYRLEMGTKLENKNGKNLYEFWGDKITKAINKELDQTESKYIINLASNEYFKAVNDKKLNGKIIDIDFREEKEDGSLQFVSFYAKKARGLMARYVSINQINSIEGLKGFNFDDYRFYEEGSSDDRLLFIR